MKKYKKPYPAEFRMQIIELAKAGRSPQELSAEFGCDITTIRGWLRKAHIGILSKAAKQAQLLEDHERAELHRLRREVKQLKTERDILAKATAWFAQQDGGIVK